MDQFTSPNRSKAVLITIDMQKDFCLQKGAAYVQGSEEIIPSLEKLVRSFREHKNPIYHIIRLYKKDGSNAELSRKKSIREGKELVAPGAWGAEPVDAIMPDHAASPNPDTLLAGSPQAAGPMEWMLYKPRWGAFYNTPLEELLAQQGIDTLVFCGCNFPNCPRTSIYEASERDFKIVLASDAVSGLYEKGIRELEGIGVRMMTVEEILGWI